MGASHVREKVWRFVRGDDTAEVFEAWLYQHVDDPVLKSKLGDQLLLHALETNFMNPEQVWELRTAIRNAAREDLLSCCCLSWRDEQRLPIGLDPETDAVESVDEFVARFTVRQRRTPWLLYATCRVCEQAWYIAIDTFDDEYHLHRISKTEVEALTSQRWPTVFDDFDHVWPTQEWLTLFGHATLREWQEANPNAT